MLFQCLFRLPPPRRPNLPLRLPRRWNAARPRVEALEDRSLLSGLVTLASSDDTPLVGERITWTATAFDVGATPVYQFRVAPHDGQSQIVRDYNPTSSFVWTPMQEGDYHIEVIVKDGYAATDTTSAAVSDEVGSRVTGSQAVITPTANPLVALYSVPPSAAETVRIQFAVAGDDPQWRNTDTRVIEAGTSTNFFVAGMLPGTTYQMRHVLSDGTGSEPLTFTTGSLPATLSFPAFTVTGPGSGSDQSEDIIFHQRARFASSIPNPLATDLQGRVVWYYDVTNSGLTFNFPIQNLVPGGTVMVTGADSSVPAPSARNVVREIDLAGNPLRETSIAAINAQLTSMGHDIIYSFTNDVRRLPNGHTAVIGVTEHTVNVNGTPTDYVGMMIIVLDDNFQVAWVWDGFDHLDVSRGPVLGEVLFPGSTEPTAVVPRFPAVDWLHINNVDWSPADGNLVLSVRHQDWVIKIDYARGEGDGHVVWRLGAGGDFTLNSEEDDAWFSHQHNAHYIDDHTLVLFDNGNTRRASDPAANNRGQVWALDETSMTATPVVNVDLGVYSDRVGSAQRLSNGNYYFTSGFLGSNPNRFGREIEVRPDGTQVYVLETGHLNQTMYRSFRMRTLYEGLDDTLAGNPQRVESVVINDGSTQRSMVNSITVTFDGAALLDPGAVELRRQDGSLMGAQFDISLVGDKTVAVLTFAASEFIGASLADGSYTLAILAGHVHDRWGRELDGDSDGLAGGDRVDAFFRLFGDSDGDGGVDHDDLDRMLISFLKHRGDAGFLWYFDYDGDDVVDGLDMAQFNHRRGK